MALQLLFSNHTIPISNRHEQRIRILPPDPRGFGVGAPSSYYSVGGFTFLASPGGELSLFIDSKAIVFDISLDIGDGEPPPDPLMKTAAN